MNNISDKDHESDGNNTPGTTAVKTNKVVHLCDRSNKWMVVILIIILTITILQMSELLKILDALRKMNGNS